MTGLEIIPCGWVLMDKPWEVLPTDDIREHTVGIDCACHPHISDEDDETVVHSAFDGREDFTNGTRKVS